MDSTTEKKLNYLSETKDLIRKAIAAQGVEISTSDTFRSYAEKIESIENAGGGGSSEKIIYAEQTLDFSYNSDYGAFHYYQNPNEFTLVAGEAYFIVWDGAEVERTATAWTNPADNSNCVFLGNPVVTGGESNGDTFAVVYDETHSVNHFFSTEQDASHTMKIYQKVEENKYEDVHFVTFMNEDGTVELYKRPVADGDNCADPVARGLMDEPTKESTAQYSYTHVGWSATAGGALDSNILKAVTADKTVYANFAAVLRYYTVNFYDGETLLNTENIAYGGSSSYTYAKENYVFLGWTPSPTNIAGNMDCYGEWEESYAFADASWDYIAEKAEAGTAASYFSLGDTKTISFKWYDGTEDTTEVQIIGFNHDDLSDGSGKAGITLGLKHGLYGRSLINTNNNCTAWESSTHRTNLNSTFFDGLSSELSQHIKTVVKTSAVSWTDATTYVDTDDKIFILSARENGETNTSVGWGGEGESYEYYLTQANRKKYAQTMDGVDTESYEGYSTKSRAKNSAYLPYSVDKNGAFTNSSYTQWSIGFCI